MEQTARSAARARSEVALIDDRGAKRSHGRIARDAGADNASADDEHVERPSAKRSQIAFAPFI
jgi:hypothetical protein